MSIFHCQQKNKNDSKKNSIRQKYLYKFEVKKNIKYKEVEKL
jgi:hypothetical protein